MIAVIDSSIWISALNFGGSPLRALEHVFRYHDIAISEEILFEVFKTLTRKFDWLDVEVRREMSRYLQGAIHIDEIGGLHGVCRDPKDDMIIECAVLASADLIVTGDRDLLVLGTFRNVRIVTVRQYLDEGA